RKRNHFWRQTGHIVAHHVFHFSFNGEGLRGRWFHQHRELRRATVVAHHHSEVLIEFLHRFGLRQRHINLVKLALLETEDRRQRTFIARQLRRVQVPAFLHLRRQRHQHFAIL